MNVTPNFDAFRPSYEAGRPQILVRRLISDLETPVSVYLKIAARRKNAFLLESVEGGEKLGRYSVIGLRPDAMWRASGSVAEINWRAAADIDDFACDERPPLESLKAFVDASAIDLPADAPPMAAGVFGYLSYDMARQMERLPDRPQSAFPAPDAIFIRPTLIAVFDNLRQEILFVATVRPEKGVTAPGLASGNAAWNPEWGKSAGAGRMTEPNAQVIMNRVLNLAARYSVAGVNAKTVSVYAKNDKSNSCLSFAALTLKQCIAATRAPYEEAFCLGEHALNDTASCIGWVAGAE